jgi:carbon-monoxide dehydrogenase medium subunit/xanthine dehydrogenase FAD-binding subunit
LIDINKIDELHSIQMSENEIMIGAATTFSEIQENLLIEKYLPLLKKAVSTIGSLQIRNKATIAGNFVNNAPCADSVPALLVYDARIELQSLNKKRELLLEDFLMEPYKTQLDSNEIVTKIIIPIPKENYKSDFYKLGRRRAVAISRITLAVLCNVKNNTFNDIKIASGAVTPIGKRFKEIENFAKGKKITNELLIQLSQKLGEEILQATGLRWSTAYKLPVVQQTFYQLLFNLTYKSNENKIHS